MQDESIIASFQLSFFLKMRKNTKRVPFVLDVWGVLAYISPRIWLFSFMKSEDFKRRSNYDATRTTTRHISNLLPRLLEEIGRKFEERPDLILAAWPDVIGGQLAHMTQAISFNEGVLTVKVKSSTLFSLLSQNDKPRLIKNLRDKFPGMLIKTIYFKLG